MSGHFRFEREDDGLGLLTFDSPGEKVNKYAADALEELDGWLGELASRGDVKALVLLSGKPGIFIAGADVKQIATATAEEAGPAVRRGQEVFGRLASLPFPTVAAIGGACVGGGLETALACDWRLASDASKVQIGLPEVRIGILPAWGGTTRLPRVIGLAAGLDLILSGRTLDGRRAHRVGLVDELVPHALLDARARAFARERFGTRKRADAARDGGPVRARSRSVVDSVLETVGRGIVFSRARATLMKQTGGHYPAPLEALGAVREGYGRNLAVGLDLERKHVARLVGTPVMRNLVTLFLRTELVKKENGTEGMSPPAPGLAGRAVARLGVIGAGVMGGGIAQLAAEKGIPARMKDVAEDALARGYAAAARVWEERISRRRLSRRELPVKMGLLSGTLDYTGFERCEVTVEAIVEKLEVKQAVLREWEGAVGERAIFASNTSTLPITRIQAVAEHPGRVVGMHFFNPVHRMPLVEVIYGEQTSPEATATVFELARRLGKTPVVVRDAPGFLVNRLLSPYLGEAARLLLEGCTAESIDRAMRRFGMPVGPIELLDDVGLDVAAKAADTMAAAWPERLPTDPLLHQLAESGRLGRKAGRGFYRYEGRHRRGADPGLFAEIGAAAPTREIAPEDAERRLLFPMVNEAARCLDEGIVPAADKLDLAMVFGTGFPPFRGGPLRYADARGIATILDGLLALQQKHGARFTPCAGLSSRRSGSGFF